MRTRDITMPSLREKEKDRPVPSVFVFSSQPSKKHEGNYDDNDGDGGDDGDEEEEVEEENVSSLFSFHCFSLNAILSPTLLSLSREEEDELVSVHRALRLSRS